MSDVKLNFENWYKLTYDKGCFIYPSQPMDKISFNTMVERVELYNRYAGEVLVTNNSIKNGFICPKCNSSSIYTQDIEVYHDCNNCGHDWTT